MTVLSLLGFVFLVFISGYFTLVAFVWGFGSMLMGGRADPGSAIFAGIAALLWYFTWQMSPFEIAVKVVS